MELTDIDLKTENSVLSKRLESDQKLLRGMETKVDGLAAKCKRYRQQFVAERLSRPKSARSIQTSPRRPRLVSPHSINEIVKDSEKAMRNFKELTSANRVIANVSSATPPYESVTDGALYKLVTRQLENTKDENKVRLFVRCCDSLIKSRVHCRSFAQR